MNHDEAAELLGAYALDAVDREESELIEEHLLDCPRCRAELRSYREVAAALGNSTAPAPEGVWERIASQISSEDAPPSQPGPVFLSSRRAAPRWRRVALPSVAAIAAAAFAILGLSVGHLSHELGGLQAATASRGLAPAVAATALGPHQTVTLSAARLPASAKVEIAPDGTAYWVSSTLPVLSSGRTYQLWAEVNGRVVSIALLGPNPQAYAALRVAPGTTGLMVTAEPEGGVVQPTAPPLVRGPVPTA